VARRYTLDLSGGVSTGIDYAAELNAQQLAAVTSAPGAALVIAGAGSGKTRTLTYRVAWLLEQGVSAGSILLLTFTNKAAREMLDRVASLLPQGAAGIWGGTFHSIGNRILRRHAQHLGFRQGFTIMDREDQNELIASILAQEGLRTTDRRFPKPEVLADIFSYGVNTSSSIVQVLTSNYQYFLPLAEEIAHAQSIYEVRKKEANAMDFDDLLSKTLELFRTADDVAALYQEKFEHVLVDEYQDTNHLQAELVELIASRHGNIMVVGDDAQSIYSWRGADFENILKFPEKHPKAHTFKIETNYRSVPEVLEVANAAIRGNEQQFSKTLVAARRSHALRPAVVSLATNSQQAAFVAQRVLELHEEGVGLHEIAVLYRAHYHSMEVQLEFTRRGIPFTITSGLRFFEQAHIKDVAAFLKLAVNPHDETAFKRIVKLFPGVGPKAAESLWSQVNAQLEGQREFSRMGAIRPPAKAQEAWRQFVATMMELAPPSGLLPPSMMIESVGYAIYDDYMKTKFANYEMRQQDIVTLSGFAREFESCEDFLSQLALLGAVETADTFYGEPELEKITLSTLHQAKGLEWKVVFLIWLADGMFPASRTFANPEALEEERRLFYVGITRCRDELYMTYPGKRLNAAYAEAPQRPSRFLMEVPESLLEAWEISTAKPGAADPF
jgi:DNA helicase II / ATP-dependent DNA helicase PcrA